MSDINKWEIRDVFKFIEKVRFDVYWVVYI